MSQNNRQEIIRKMEDQRQRFSLRKYGVGVASVLIGLTFMGGYTVTAHADTQTAPVVAVQDSQSSSDGETNSTANQPVADSAVSSQATASQETSDSAVKSTSAPSATPAEISAAAISADQDAKSTSQSQAGSSTQAPSVSAASVLTNLAVQPASENAQYNVNDWSYTTNADGSGITITGYKGTTPADGAYYIPNSADFRNAGKITAEQQASIDRNVIKHIVENGATSIIIHRANKGTKDGLLAVNSGNENTWGAGFSSGINNNYDADIDPDHAGQPNTTLKYVDVSGLDVSQVTKFEGMFANDKALEKVVGLDTWNVANCRVFGHMFAYDPKLATVSGLEAWGQDTKNVEYIDNMFIGDKSLGSLDLSSWNTNKVISSAHMFDGASSLTSVGDLSNWDLSNVTDTSYMFNNAKSLKTISDGTTTKVNKWGMSSVQNTRDMFAHTQALTSAGDLSNWNLKNDTDASYMFFDARSITDLGNLDNWFPQGSKVTTLQGMFDYTPKLEKLSDTEKGVGNWDVSNVTNMGQLFRENQNPDDSNAGNNGKLSDYGALKQIGDLSSWDVSKVTYLEGMFQGMSATSVGDLSGWRFNSLAGYNPTTNKYDGPVSIGYMFQGAHNLTNIGDISHWFDNQQGAVANLNHAFDDSGLEKINISGWKFADNADVSAMFTNLHNPATITANNLTNAPTFTANDFSRIKTYGGQGFQSTATDQPLIVISNSISTDLNNQTLGGGDFLGSGKGHPANTVTFVSTSDENTPVASQQQNFVFANTDALNTALGNISKDSNIDTVQYGNGNLTGKYVAGTGAYLNGKHNATGTEYADNYGKIAGTYSIQTQQDVTDQQIAAHDPQLEPISRQYLVVERFPKSYGNTHHDVLTAEQYRSQYPTATDVSDDYVYKVVLENNATIYKTATKNLLNNQITYSNNYSEQHIVYDNPIGNFTKPGDDKSYSANNPVDQPAGYTPSSQNWSSKKYNSRGSDMLIYNYDPDTKEYTYDFINSVPGSVVTDTFTADDVPASRQFYIDYTADKAEQTIKYVDGDGKTISSQTIDGKVGDTVQVTPQIPAGWVLDNGQKVPGSVTLKDTDTPIQVKIKHGTTVVQPNDPKTPSDKLPDNPNMNYPAGVSQDDLNKTITRTIKITKPDGTVIDKTKTLRFERTATVDEVTGEVTYGDWTPAKDGSASFGEVDVPAIKGYTPTQSDIPAKNLTNDEITNWKDTPVNVTYIADEQTGKIIYVDENGTEISSTELTGKTGGEVTITPHVPAGYEIAPGQEIPATETATADGIPEVKVKVVPATITVTPDDPKNPSDQLPDGTKTATTYPGNGTDKGTYPAGVSKDDLNKTVTRKIAVTNPDGTSTVITQEVKFTRTATINLVDGSVTYGDWVPDGNDTLAGYTAPTIPGYTASGSAPQVANVQVTDTFGDVHIVYVADQHNGGDQPGTAGNTTAGNVVNSSANIPAAAPKQGAQQLPQTGNDSRQAATVAGLALASLAGIFGFGTKRKKED